MIWYYGGKEPRIAPRISDFPDWHLLLTSDPDMQCIGTLSFDRHQYLITPTYDACVEFITPILHHAHFSSFSTRINGSHHLRFLSTGTNIYYTSTLPSNTGTFSEPEFPWHTPIVSHLSLDPDCASHLSPQNSD